MSNSWFRFKQFMVEQEHNAMKVTTDACLFGAWLAAKNKESFGLALDIGTGTGLLSLMVAQKAPELLIDAVEIDGLAADEAQKNFIASPFRERVQLVHKNIKHYHPPQKYDLVFSNPPFYEKELSSPDPRKKMAHHNDELPLRELLQIISQLLDDSGKFFLLLPYKRRTEIRKLFDETDLGIESIMLVRQSPRHDYFRMMLQGGMKKQWQEGELNEITIMNDGNSYTEEFVALLKDYYLQF